MLNPYTQSVIHVYFIYRIHETDENYLPCQSGIDESFMYVYTSFNFSEGKNFRTVSLANFIGVTPPPFGQKNLPKTAIFRAAQSPCFQDRIRMVDTFVKRGRNTPL